MNIHFTKKNVDTIDCDLLTLGCTEEERPLRGASGLVDWRLYGAISRAVQQNCFNGGANETLLVPGGRQIRARWIVLVGLGSGLEITEKTGVLFGQRAVEAARKLKAVSCGLFYPDALTHSPYRQKALPWLLQGASAALANHAKSGFANRLTLLIPSCTEEEVDLSEVIIPKLLSRHRVPTQPC